MKDERTPSGPSDGSPRVRVAADHLSVAGQAPVRRASAMASCNHEWIRQPDGSHLCWKCGEERPSRAANVRMSDAPPEPSDLPSACKARSTPCAGSGNPEITAARETQKAPWSGGVGGE